MRLPFPLSMIPHTARNQFRRPTILLFLFLATFGTTLCRATNSFTNDVMYGGLLGEDTGTGFEPLLLDAHESHLVTRQSNESIPLSDNSIVAMLINPGTTDFWTFSPSNLKINGPTTLYITISTCTQPSPQSGLNATEIYANQTLPALQLYVSTDASNTRPGPDTDATKQDMRELVLGFTNITLDDITSDVYISVVAQNVSSDWQGGWTYQLGSSTNRNNSSIALLMLESLQSVLGGQNLFVIDTSQTEALITTGNLSTSEPQPFQIYAVLKDSDVVFSSLSNSYCVFRSNPSLFTTANAQVSMTTRGAGGLPKQQFLLGGLNASTEYNIYLTLPSTNDTSSNQGVVYPPSVSIKTKSSDTCQLVFNLPFCTETAYAAPANPNNLNSSALGSFYDSFASSQFANFSTSLQLTACNTTLSAQYSLFRNCSTCLSAYKNWLCAVTIPRCADSTDQTPYLFDRPINTSRNPLIDQTVEPGPYKELMPCSDLCFAVEQNCPSTLSFTCPILGSFGMQNSYVEDNTGKTCNAPQLQYLASRGGRVEVGRWVIVVIAVHLALWITWGYY